MAGEVAHVHGDRHGPPARGFDRLADLVQILHASCRHGHVRPAAGEAQGKCSTDAARGARHQRFAAGEGEAGEGIGSGLLVHVR